jgi:hypothetical protein
LTLTLRLSLTLRGRHCRLFERTGSHRILTGRKLFAVALRDQFIGHTGQTGVFNEVLTCLGTPYKDGLPEADSRLAKLKTFNLEWHVESKK